MAVDERRIAVLGAGKIGEALISGLLSSGWREPRDIVATGRRPERLDELKKRYRIRTTLSNAEAASGAALVVIAVKPQDLEVLLGDVGGLLSSEQTVLTIAAAIPTATVERSLGPGVPVVRAMPNTPSTVHEGMAGLCAGAHAGEEHLRLAEEALLHLGAVVRVPEGSMDAITTSAAPLAASALERVVRIRYRFFSSARRSARRPVATMSRGSRQPEESSPEMSASPILPAPRTAIRRSSTAIAE